MSSGFASFDDEVYEKTKGKPEFPSDQSKDVPSGEYTVELKEARMKETTGGDIFTFVGIIQTDGLYKGWHLEKTIFFDKKKGTDEEKLEYRKKRLGELKTDLTRLGFDVAEWTVANGRPFSAQLKIACGLMKGVKVRMRKKVGDEFTNVYIDKRLEDGKPAKFTPEMMAEAAGKQAEEGKPLNSDQSAPFDVVPGDDKKGESKGESGDPIPF